MKSTEDAIKILEALRDKWASHYYFLEKTAGYSEDALATFNKAQSRLIGELSSDLYGAICEIKEMF